MQELLLRQTDKGKGGGGKQEIKNKLSY